VVKQLIQAATGKHLHRREEVLLITAHVHTEQMVDSDICTTHIYRYS